MADGKRYYTAKALMHNDGIDSGTVCSESIKSA